MSNTPIQDPPAQGLSSDSGQTLPSRPLQSISEPSTSKRVCFYKSGDYTFSGHRMIITARTFKTFDALLDSLSKKVPLPFGVRTITTPRGTHLLKALDDLQDGGAYVCSDQKRVKPLNLDEVNQRQVPWNTTRPPSAGRRRRQGLRYGQSGKGNNAVNRPAKVTQRVTVRTPKKLVVIKNRDPTVKRTVVLQRRIAPTFDALLDYLSQILQFPVLKLYSTEGRRVDGLPTLILCSGVVVAAGNEPFRLGNYSFNRTGQTAQVMYIETEEPSTFQPVTKKNKSFSSGRGSRNFSLSSERYIVNQINKSQNGSMNGYLHNHNGSFETEANQPHEPVEMCGTGRVDDEHQTGIVPHDDDIEKSFCVNQDGSMTVEMKVRLTIKEEEMLHWTTTLSRSSLNKRTVCASVSGSGNSSPDSNNAVAKGSSNVQEDESKEENYHEGAGKGVGFNDERLYEGYTSTALGKAKTSFKRSPTPGPRHVNKKTSVESVKMITETGVQESTLGHYSYMERTAAGETTEGYCVVRHSSSSSNRPIPKPRKTASAGANNNRSSIKSSGVAEVLQLRNDGMEVTETVMHIYESQGCFDNYFANDEYSPEGTSSHSSPPMSESKPSTDSRPPSSSNDCDIDCNWQPPTADSPQRQKEEMLSLSSEPESLMHQVTNSLTSLTENEAQVAVNRENLETVKEDNNPKSKKKKNIRLVRNEKNSASTSITDKKPKESIIGSSKHSRYSSTDKLSSDASVGKKSLNSLKSSKSSLKSKGVEKPQPKRPVKDEKSLGKDSASLVSSENVKRTPSQRQNANKTAAKDNGYNVNTPTGRPQMKKNMSDILETKKSLSTGKRTISKPKSMIEYSLSQPNKSLELSESGSMPSLNPTPSLIHQYVENWLEKVSPDQVPYTEEPIIDEADTRTRVVFKIGDDSESDEINECQSNLNDVMKKSSPCLSVPIYHEGPVSAPLLSDHRTRGLCVSMPSVSADPVHQENRLRLHKSTEAIVPDDSEISTSNILSPKAKINPVLRQLCSSIQCIRRASASNEASTLQNSNSLPDFSKPATSVFDSSCKAFMSFLSVVTLRESLKGSGESNQSRTTSEAMLMMESLQRISTIEDEDEQRASLTDLQSRASSQLRERWNDFRILRERFESEPLSPRVSETEFALDVVSEVGDAFEDQDMRIDELMDELNMPQELRAEITSTIQQAKSFYPVEESTFVETVRNQSDTEEDVEQFVKECSDETKHSPEPNRTTEDITKVTQGNDEPEEDQELQTENNEPSKDKEKEAVEQVEIRESENITVIETDEENDNEERAKENNNEEGGIQEEEKNEEQEDGEDEKESDEESVQKVEEGTGGQITGEVEEMGERLEVGEKEEAEETDEGLVEEETGEDNSDKDTDEREGAAETEEEDKSMEGETEEKQGENEEETESIITEREDKEEEDPNSQDEEEEVKEGIVETGGLILKDAEEELGEEEVEETDAVTDKHVEEEVFEERNEEIDVDVEEKEEEEKEQFIEMVSEGNDEEEDSEEEEEIENEKDTDSEKETEEEKCDVVEDSRKVLEKTRLSLMEESTEKEVIDESEVEENMAAEQTVDEEEQGSVEENKLDEGLKHMETQSTDEIEEGHVSEDVDSFADDKDCKSVLEEASSLQQPTSSCEDTKSKHSTESPATYSSEGQGEDDKGVHETDEVGEEHEERSSSSSQPMEISQELLDFVNYALQSCALIFTYDNQGKVRIEPEDARVVQTKQSMIPKVRKDSSYGLKCLPSPITSDLSDYRPETSESGGYKTQESLDIVSESGEEASGKCFQVHHHSAERMERSNIEQDGSKLSVAYSSDALHNSLVGSFSSADTGIKPSREDLSYLSAASSLNGDTEADTQNVQRIAFNTDKDSADGVLIDRGRWLLKENHLIRKSPPVSLGMYGNFDSTSVDTGQENTSEGSPPHSKTQHWPLVALSSSELEDMAKPLTPKCTYYNMPHGSDSDPFLDDSSIRSGKQDSISVKGRGFRVSPTVDTSKTWANRNGSLSSFASVEFKIPDRKVHPESESSAVTQARRTPSGGQGVLQAQDSRDSLHLRCSQYCPIL